MIKSIYILTLIVLTSMTTPLVADQMFSGQETTEINYHSAQKEVLIKIQDYTAATLEVYNILGSRMMVVTLPDSYSRVSLNRLPEGQYILKVSTPQGKLLGVKKCALY